MKQIYFFTLSAKIPPVWRWGCRGSISRSLRLARKAMLRNWWWRKITGTQIPWEQVWTECRIWMGQLPTHHPSAPEHPVETSSDGPFRINQETLWQLPEGSTMTITEMTTTPWVFNVKFGWHKVKQNCHSFCPLSPPKHFPPGPRQEEGHSRDFCNAGLPRYYPEWITEIYTLD